MNEKLEKIKDEYMEIKAPDSLREKLKTTMADPKYSRGKAPMWKKISTIAACFMALLIVSLNANQALAASISDLPGMNGLVNVLTFGRYVVSEDGYEADVTTPKIEGLLDKELEEKLNKEFADNANAVILAFEGEMKALKEEFPGEEVHMGVDSGYVVKTHNEEIIAIDVYVVNIVGSSSTTHKYYNIDVKTNKLLSLSDLFKEGEDYIEPISKYIKEEMIRQNQISEGTYWLEDEFADEFDKIKPDHSFYIKNSGDIVICFDKYELGPGSSGCPEFIIPNDIIKNIRK